MAKFDPKTIIDHASAQMIAGIAWGLALLLVLMATARAGDRGLEVLIAGIGAVGQVAIAVLVWRLSVKQFEFTKLSAEQNATSALNERRIALLNEYVSWSNRNLGMKEDFQLLELTAISLKARTVFSHDIISMLASLAKLGAQRKSAFQAVAVAKNDSDPAMFMEAQRLQIDAVEAFFHAHMLLMAEMAISLEKLNHE